MGSFLYNLKITLGNFPFFIFAFILSIHPFVCAVFGACDPPVSCNQTGPMIQFPFWRKQQPSDTCGYSRFELSCNNKNETILRLPVSGEFIVKDIDYTQQVIVINDPDSCLPKRMANLTVLGSPFRGINLRGYKFKFFNCSSTLISDPGNTRYLDIPMVCGSGRNYKIYAVPSLMADLGMPSFCLELNSNGSVAPDWSTSNYWSSMNNEGDLQLLWIDPVRCWSCAAQGLRCGITDDNRVGCVRPQESKNGLPRSVKYGIIIGVGIPALLFIIGLACHICSRIKAYSLQRRINAELSANIAPRPVVIVTGLDGQTIESYPKTVLGESRRLPKPSDSTCPICLSEYEPTETLRTIPECNHYFHADCIDEWLKLNGTCPLCRNSPESLSVTPCSSMSSSTTSTSS